MKYLTIGVDEVGRGCLVGEVVSAAVVLPEGAVEGLQIEGLRIEGLRDSKKLSAKRRLELSQVIQQRAMFWAISSCSAREVDELNIHHASLLAMKRAIIKLIGCAQQRFAVQQRFVELSCEVLIDGKYVPDLAGVFSKQVQLKTTTVVKGDELHSCISAASILAKVYRDETMLELHQSHPQFGFSRHKGYPSKEHLQALEEFGVLADHRRSYQPVRRVLAQVQGG